MSEATRQRIDDFFFGLPAAAAANFIAASAFGNAFAIFAAVNYSIVNDVRCR
jgi:hypothetical protein